MSPSSIRPLYDMWPQYARRLREVIGAMSAEQLAIRPAPDGWPIWATVGHTAGTRTYWLCHVVGEPGVETTPFRDLVDSGWEDDLDHPRTADELVEALDSTWRIVEGCLDRWTLETLADPIPAPGLVPGSHPRLDPAAPLQPRRLPLRRAVADPRHPRTAADRPLAPGLIRSVRAARSVMISGLAVVNGERSQAP